MPVEDNVLKIIRHSVGRKRATFGHGFDAAYHSITINGKRFKGQREVSKRIESIPYDFSGKVVLDLGCNIGGMLHELSGIRHGIGLDYNSKCINAANLIKTVNGATHLDFYTFDLQKEPLNLIDNFLIGYNVDVCFVLAIALWVSNWKSVVAYCHKTSPCLVYESNGKDDFQREQEDFLRRLYRSVDLLADKSFDDNRKGKGTKLRKLFMCKK